MYCNWLHCLVYKCTTMTLGMISLNKYMKITILMEQNTHTFSYIYTLAVVEIRH